MEESKVRLSKLQQFEVQVLNRSELLNCPYNPRQIDETAKKKLRSNIKKVGLLQPIVWNKRTKHIVSGHQRIAIMDSIERNADYNIQVAVVDLDEKTEKEQVVFMNNELAMGTFDLPKLEKLLTEISFEDCGFEKLDLEVLLPSWSKQQTPEAQQQETEVGQMVNDISSKKIRSDFGQKHGGHPGKAAPSEDEEEFEDTEDLEAIREKKQQVIEEGNKNNPENADVEFFLVLVFPDRDEAENFLDLIKISRQEKYISGTLVRDLIAKEQAGAERTV